jgi:subtilisin family serine protease
MKNLKSIFVFVVMLFSAVNLFAQKSKEVFVKDELLVKFKDGTASRAAVERHQLTGAKIVEEFPELGWQRIKLPSGMSVSNAENRYKNFDGIETAQPNYYYHLLATPNDAQFGSMYGMTKISAPQAWDLHTGSSTVVVADIDTGMKMTHEDLAPNLWINTGEIAGNNVDDDGNGYIDDVNGYDFFFNDSDPTDENGHGTHTAGTVGARGNNTLGVTGVNWNVKLLPIKIYNSSGFGTTSAMLINAYNYIRIMKNRGVNIRATNNSYGGCDEACGYDQATKDAIDALGNADVLQAFAAGNNGTNNDVTPFYPANYTSPSIISVASSTSTDARSSFSCFGATTVDIAAPGSSILSTIISGTGYGNLSGTSMATPHVAGAAALVAAQHPTLSAASIKATLMNNVDNLVVWNGLVKSNGRLNVFKALQNPTVCSFTPSLASQGVTVPGGSYSFNVTSPTNCDYSATTNVNWITVNGGNPSSGNGTINYTVAQNSSLPRSGTIRIGDQNFQVTQQGNEIQTPNKTVLDFDRDFKSDYVAIQNVNGSMVWHIWQSSAGYKVVTFGLFTDTIVPADYDGDGATDIAVFRATAADNQPDFYILKSSDNSVAGISWGTTNDFPFVNDFDGDNKADYAVIRKENGKLIWYIIQSTAGYRAFQFGNDTDTPLRGDFDGDGKADVNVFRPSTNTFYSSKSSVSSVAITTFGTSSTDKIVSGDFDGDGKSDIAVWRSTTGVWYWISSINSSFNVYQFGIGTDLPTPADYDGDGKTDLSVWRPDTSSSIFYSQRSTAGFTAFNWGNSAMKIPANLLQTAN